MKAMPARRLTIMTMGFGMLRAVNGFAAHGDGVASAPVRITAKRAYLQQLPSNAVRRQSHIWQVGRVAQRRAIRGGIREPQRIFEHCERMGVISA